METRATMNRDSKREDRDVDELARLIEQGTISDRSAAYGVALQVISHGRRSLDRRQESLYETEVAPLIRANRAMDGAVRKDDEAS